MKRASSLRAGFTLIELLTVMSIIMVLAGMTLAGVKYAQTKAAESRATAEIQAISTALESYKADNGEYPNDTSSNSLDPKAGTAPTEQASLTLYRALVGLDAAPSSKTAPRFSPSGSKRYMEVRPNLLLPRTGDTVTAFVDPWQRPYGYSTAYAADVTNNINPPTHGYNPTFDLWSSGDPDNQLEHSSDVAKKQAKWIKNW